MKQEERYKTVLERFAREMPSPKTELHYENPYQILVAVILSAQCTDKRVNMITPALFKAFPTPEALAKGTREEIYELIKSCSYPNNKTKSLMGMARKLVDDFGGEVPCDIDSLMSLPGVGRKTANVILAVVFDRPAMPVDTHVFRVAERIGLTTGSKTPLSTEKKLAEKIPDEILSNAHHWLILHGRYVCQARKPKCDRCFLADVCRYNERQKSKADRAVAKVRAMADEPKKE